MKPVLQALVLAERIYEDKSGKKIITGTFNALNILKRRPAESFVDDNGVQKLRIEGGQPGSPYAYISLTDVCDNTKLELQFVSLKKNRVIFENDIVVRCQNRLATVELVAALPPLVVTEPGVYAFEVVCEGEVIGSHRIIVELIDDVSTES